MHVRPDKRPHSDTDTTPVKNEQKNTGNNSSANSLKSPKKIRVESPLKQHTPKSPNGEPKKRGRPPGSISSEKKPAKAKISKVPLMCPVKPSVSKTDKHVVGGVTLQRCRRQTCKNRNKPSCSVNLVDK